MTREEVKRDDDDPALRKVLGYRLRAHVRYQDGRHSEAPSVIFADADYEAGDGTCGLHSDGKSANEPAIVYVRADALMDALARAEQAEAENDRAVDIINAARQERNEARARPVTVQEAAKVLIAECERRAEGVQSYDDDIFLSHADFDSFSSSLRALTQEGDT